MTMEAGSRRWLTMALFAAAMLPLLATPVLPLIDFYNHLARFFVLSHVGASPMLQSYYQSHWTLLPDIGVDVLGTPILAVIPPMIAGHLIVIAILAVIYSGALYFQRAVTGQRSPLVALLLLPLLYSYILNWGFANFLLGLGFAFWAAGWWFLNRPRPFLAVPVSCVLSILIFLTHGLAFALYGVMVASLEVGRFIKAPKHPPMDLVKSLLLTAIQALIPLAFLAYWLVANAKVGHITPPQTILPPELTGFPPGLTGRILKRLVPILRVEEGPSYLFDIVTLAVQALAVLFLFAAGRIRISALAWPLLVAAALTVGIGAPTIFGVSYITDRMPLFALLCFITVLTVRPGQWGFASKVACGVIAAVVAIRLIAVAASWYGYGADYRAFQAIAKEIPPGSLTLGVGVGAAFHETNVPRCEMFGPLLVATHGQAGPLFADPKQQPLALAGRLKSAVDALHESHPLERPSDYNTYMKDAVIAGFDYLLVCNVQLLKQPFPANTAVMAQAGHFVLLKAVR